MSRPNYVYVLESKKRGTKEKYQPTDFITFTRKDARGMVKDVQDPQIQFRFTKYVAQE